MLQTTRMMTESEDPPSLFHDPPQPPDQAPDRPRPAASIFYIHHISFEPSPRCFSILPPPVLVGTQDTTDEIGTGDDLIGSSGDEMAGECELNTSTDAIHSEGELQAEEDVPEMITSKLSFKARKFSGFPS